MLMLLEFKNICQSYPYSCNTVNPYCKFVSIIDKFIFMLVYLF